MEIYTNSVRLENGVFEILESQKEVSDVRKKIIIKYIDGLGDYEIGSSNYDKNFKIKIEIE